MGKLQSFGIIGGDKRQLYCGRSMEEDGYRVLYHGFHVSGEGFGVQNSDIETIVRECDALLLPLPCSRDGITVNAPFSERTVLLQELQSAFETKPIFCGMKSKLPCKYKQVYDYATREEFAVENAVSTGEGAIGLAIAHYEGTIHGARCLVTGYGRIGKVLSRMLQGLGADVTVSARSLKDMAMIRAFGMKAMDSGSLSGQYDLIFNTAPCLLFDAQTLAKTAANALIIDLASLPGGIDDKSAERLSIPVIHALSLPGKTAPKASGIIIKNAVYHIIREEEL